MNLGVIVLLALAAALAFLRRQDAPPAVEPHKLATVAVAAAAVTFVAWYALATLAADMHKANKPGLSCWLWWGGFVLALVAARLLAKVRRVGVDGVESKKTPATPAAARE